MSLLEFNCNKNLIYIAIYWILDITFRLISKLKSDYFKLFDNTVQNEYMYVIYKTAGDLLSGFLYLYSYHSSKSNKEKIEKDNKQDNNTDNIDYIYEEPSLAPKKNINRIIIIIGILEYIGRSNYWIAYAIIGAKKSEIYNPLQRDITNTCDIIMRYIFSIFILKIKINKLHKVSLATIGIGFLFLLVADIIDFSYKNKNLDLLITLSFSLICLIRSFASPYEHTLIQKLFKEIFILPEKIQFIKGILVSIMVIVLTIILYFSFSLDLNPNFSVETTLSMIAYILISCVKEFILLKIIDKISAQSVSFLTISKSIGNYIYGIIQLIKEEKGGIEIAYFIIEIFGILIILIAVLVYDEAIIINKWSLNYYTKKKIMERELREITNSQDEELVLN